MVMIKEVKENIIISFTATNTKTRVHTVPKNKVMIIDDILCVDTSGSANTLMLTDEGTDLANNAYTKTVWKSKVAANDDEQYQRIEHARVLNELYAVSTGNMDVVMHAHYI